jgi:uncharacterized membrane protein
MFLGLGAALMFFGDPQTGRKRRSDVKAQLDATRRRLEQGRDVVVRDAANRAHGVLVETRQMIEARRHGQPVELSLASVGRGAIEPWLRPHWSPSQRALAGAFGAAMATYGYLRGGLRGFLMCAAGGGLLARATANQELASLLRSTPLLVEKTVRIDAPVDEVFTYWRNLENFPQWMSHVREVRYIGHDRYHWSVDGPLGTPVEWDSELLNVISNREMTWRSVEGSDVAHTGRVRFEPDGDFTRVHVQLRYALPGGVVGRAVARAFGTDPESEMGDDLQRMKGAVESRRPPRDSAAMRNLGLGGNGAAAN